MKRRGGIVETRRPPVRAGDPDPADVPQRFLHQPTDGDSVVVHELAHQWYGDSLAVRRWRDIWLNEGFATYAEWLWARHEGVGTPRRSSPAPTTPSPDDPFWNLKIGDPGPNHLFDQPVYLRGAMTLHRLRQVVGDATSSGSCGAGRPPGPVGT